MSVAACTNSSREEIKRHVFNEYNAAVREYSRRVQDLAAHRRSFSSDEYLKLYRECERARMLCEAARLAVASFRSS